MKVVSIILKIVFCWIYIPYLILKWLTGGSSGSKSSGGTKSSSGGGKPALAMPVVTVKASEKNNYEITNVKVMPGSFGSGRQVLVAYKGLNGKPGSGGTHIESPSKSKGPIEVDWSKSIS